MLTDRDLGKLERLARRIGSQNAKMLLSVLGRDKKFIDVITSPIGEEIMKDVVIMIEDKLDLILNEKDSPKDRAELRAYMNILKRWQSRISTNRQNEEKLLNALGG